jgi:hypothetical protein
MTSPAPRAARSRSSASARIRGSTDGQGKDRRPRLHGSGRQTRRPGRDLGAELGEWIIAAFGLLTAGGVLVPVNTRIKAAEAGDIIRRSQAKLLLVRKNFLGLDFDFDDGKADIPVTDLKSDFLASGTPAERTVSENDVADIIYTSGTTGRPKGVMMAHAPTLRLYTEWNELAGTRPGDRCLIANPFFRIFGYKAGCIASMIRGMTILPVPVFDIDHVLDLVEREKVTVLPGPPTVYHELLPGYGLTEAGTITASRPAPRPGRQGVRGPQARPRNGRRHRTTAHRLGQSHDCGLKSAKIRRIPPRAPAERHRKSHEGPA